MALTVSVADLLRVENRDPLVVARAAVVVARGTICLHDILETDESSFAAAWAGLTQHDATDYQGFFPARSITAGDIGK